jgi:hypothetical protein
MPTLQDSDVLSPDERSAQQALAQVRPRLDAMREPDIERRLSIDASAAAVTALATATKVEPFRPELEGKFGDEATEVLDAVPTLALATRQADIDLAALAPANDLSADFEQLRSTHQLLLTDTDSLGYRGFIDPKRIDVARGVLGYQATIDSVEILVAVLREHWGTIEGHTPITAAQLDRAVALAKRLSKALGERDNGVLRAPSIETRVRVLSLLVHTYEELRRMMSYVRWHQDDVDLFAPSLWANRGRRARTRNGPNGGANGPPIDAEDPGAPAAPGPNNGGPPFTA